MSSRPSYEEMRTLMEKIRVRGLDSTKKDLRTRVAFELMATTSRIGSISKLSWGDVWLPKDESGVVKIWLNDKRPRYKTKKPWPGYEKQGGRGKGVSVPLTEEAADAIRFWHDLVEEAAKKPEGKVFDITQQTLRKHMQEFASDVLPKKRFQPHDVRRYMAIHNYRLGGNIEAVQEFLRHDNVATTVLYLRALPSTTFNMNESLAEFIGQRPDIRQGMDKQQRKVSESVSQRRKTISETDFRAERLIPNINKGDEKFQQRLDRVRDFWQALPSQARFESVIDRYQLLFPGEGLLSSGELMDDFLVEVARRSTGKDDYNVIMQLLDGAEGKYKSTLAAAQRASLGFLAPPPNLNDVFADYLYTLGEQVAVPDPKRVIGYIEGPPTLKGWVLVRLLAMK